MQKGWTKEEEDFLRKNYKTMSYQEIRLILNRKTTQIVSKKHKLFDSKYVRYSKNEVDFITNNYPQLSMKTIAVELGIKVLRVKSIIKKLQINARKTFFKHDYLSISAINQILNVPVRFLKALIKCKFIRISLFKTQIRNTVFLVHIDEFEKIKEFLNNYIDINNFAEKISYSGAVVLRRIKIGKIKDFLKVGSRYFIHKNEIELQRSL